MLKGKKAFCVKLTRFLAATDNRCTLCFFEELGIAETSQERRRDILDPARRTTTELPTTDRNEADYETKKKKKF